MKTAPGSLMFFTAAIVILNLLLLPVGQTSFQPKPKSNSVASLATSHVETVRKSASETAMKRPGAPQQELDDLPSSSMKKEGDDQLMRDLFVDERERQSRLDVLAQTGSQANEAYSYPIQKVQPAFFKGDVRDLPQIAQPDRDLPEFEGPLSARKFEGQAPGMPEPNIPLAPMPNPAQNFAGLARLDLATNGSGQIGGGSPPDTNGDVGPNHFIQSVNTGYGIFNKTGTLLASFTENSLFSGGPTGTLCDTNSTGDPVVLYDSLADRWILTNFAFTGNGTVGPFFQCIAASRTGNPVSGGWNLYAIRTDTGAAGQPPLNAINDYGKFGIWTDCLYYAANTFNSAGSYIGPQFGSFSRVDMYSGAALTASLGFTSSTNDFFTMLPSHLSAPANGLPPAGRLNLFTYESVTAFAFLVRTFTPGTNCGGTGTLSASTSVSQTAYTPAGTDVTQPNTANLLDSLSDRLMQKNQYRNVGGTESLWVTHTVRSGSVDQPQWAQINVTGGTVVTTPVQQQIYGPDATLNRWMPAIAADKDGNVALGYSTSNGTIPNFPSIAYSGRLVGDPLNQLPQTETQLIAGSGSQTGNCGGAPCHRWGDYSSMSVDPSDSCTFWYTTQYFTSQADGTNSPPIWSTRIGSFSFTQPTQCSPLASSPTVPLAPTGLTFTGVTTTGMTLNWTDNATNEDGYVIYRSTDNVTFSFAALTAANATSQAFIGLDPATTYFWKVFAFTKGALSTALTGTQATNAPTNITCNGAGGNWSLNATWTGGAVPTAGDNVTIGSGCTITIDTAAVALNVTINSGGVLQYETLNARSLTTGFSVTVDSGGVFQSATTGTQTGHTLSIGRNLTNNGTLDFSTNTNTAAAGITFTGAANNTFGGSGATTDIRSLTINKGTSNANVLELNPTSFTVQGATSAVSSFVTLTNGTLKISGSFTFNSILLTPAAYSIGATAGLWLNNPNFTVNGQNGSPTTTGLLRISQGTLNIGTGTGNSMGFNSGSTITVEGGAVNATGRFGVAAAGNAINYTQSGGTITVCTVGNASTTLASFDLGTSLTSAINISGGTIVNQLANTVGSGPRDYRNQAGGGIAGVTGGTVQLGNAGSGAAKAFDVAGVFPNLVLNNSSAGHSATMLAPAVYNNISLNITINTGNTLNIGNNLFLMNGATLTNNGTFTGNGASSRLIWFGTNLAQTYTGSGTVTAPLSDFTVQDDLGVTINAASPNIVVSVIRLFTGGVTNANKLTLGNGGATGGFIQIGNTTTPTNAGVFDVPLTFNLGTAGETISYLRTTNTRTTGPEINPARTLASMTYDDNDPTHTLAIAGGDLSMTAVPATNALTLNNGRIVTGVNTLILPNATSTVARTNGYVDGNLRKTFSAAATKVFEVGTANAFSPFTANVTGGTFPATFTVKAIQGPQPVVNPATSIQRYWTLAATGITANLTFQYVLSDVMGTEANYKVIRVIGGTSVSFPTSTVNTVAHTATLNGVSGFSDWTVGETTAPTAADGIVTGTITDPNGTAVAGAVVNLSGTQNRKTITDANGNYRFDDVETNGFYTVRPSRVNYRFSPVERSFNQLGNKTEAIFTATPDAVIGVNAIDTAEYFVRQHYVDFLGREPDESGFNFWSDQILGCGGDSGCLERKRINVSAAYFLSIEFQQTGGLVDGLYRASYGRRPLYAEFMPDAGSIGQGVVVGRGNWEQQLATNKQTFVNGWVQRAAFQSAYGSLGDDAYVDTLISHTGVSYSQVERDGLVSGLASGNLTRAGVLLRIAEEQQFVSGKRNEMFVMMEYFGYLRRDPDASGYQFWLNKLNQFNGNFEQAEMVKAFIVSGEYRGRFGL